MLPADAPPPVIMPTTRPAAAPATIPRKPPDVAVLRKQLRRALALAGLGLKDATLITGKLAWLGARNGLGVLLALIVLFEQWGWKPLAAMLAAVAHLAPVAAMERGIARLPPYGALAVFGVPVLLLIPVKLFALYLIANGHTASAVALFIAAKIFGTAIVGRIYHLTEPQLMQIGWVRQIHDVAMPRLHAIHESIRRSWAWRYGRMLKTSAKLALRRRWPRLTEQVASVLSRAMSRL